MREIRLVVCLLVLLGTAGTVASARVTAMPGLLYGLWLLRRIGQRNKWEFIGEESNRGRLDPLGAEVL